MHSSFKRQEVVKLSDLYLHFILLSEYYSILSHNICIFPLTPVSIMINILASCNPEGPSLDAPLELAQEQG